MREGGGQWVIFRRDPLAGAVERVDRRDVARVEDKTSLGLGWVSGLRAANRRFFDDG